MMENTMTPEEFVLLMKGKRRKITYTQHSAERAKRRCLPLFVFENDLEGEVPVAVFEQEPEANHERKFDIYYRQAGDLFHRYILCTNESIRLITLMRTSKSRQKEVSKIR
jgi:hypothetical protein